MKPTKSKAPKAKKCKFCCAVPAVVGKDACVECAKLVKTLARLGAKP